MNKRVEGSGATGEARGAGRQLDFLRRAKERIGKAEKVRIFFPDGLKHPEGDRGRFTIIPAPPGLTDVMTEAHVHPDSNPI